MKEHKFELGQPVKDVITGFKGVAMARIEFLTGCTQYGVTPKLGSDGKIPDTNYFDEDRLVADGKPIKLQPKRTDGPGPAPKARKDGRHV